MASYRRIIGPTDTTFVRGGVRFILMDDVRGKGAQGYEAGFREDQKAWLSAVLAETPPQTLAVLSAHIPFSEFKALDSLETILSRHPRLLLMSAHTHTMARHTLVLPAGLAVEEVLAGATCGSWWRGVPDERGIPRSYQNCGAPPCYYLADFSGGEYRLDYKTLGRPASEKASAWVVDSSRLVLTERLWRRHRRDGPGEAARTAPLDHRPRQRGSGSRTDRRGTLQQDAGRQRPRPEPPPHPHATHRLAPCLGHRPERLSPAPFRPSAFRREAGENPLQRSLAVFLDQRGSFRAVIWRHFRQNPYICGN